MSQMNSGVVLYKKSGDAGIITINRPDANNALNEEIVKRLTLIFKKYAHQGVKMFVLESTGPHFMVGGDVQVFKLLKLSGAARQAQMKPIMNEVHEMMHAMIKCPIPIIAKVNGSVAGFGIGLMLACDIIVMSTKSKVDLAYLNLALTPDGLTSKLLTQTIGLKRALSFALLGQRLNAQDAYNLGFASELVDAKDLNQVVDGMIQKMSLWSHRSMVLTKRLLRSSLDQSFEYQSQDEMDFFRMCLESDDFIEGVQAFLEKRAPKFKN